MFPDEQRLFSRCLDKIDDKKDLVLSAKCLILARKRFKKRKNQKPTVIKPKDNQWMGGFRVRDKNDPISSQNMTKNSTSFIIENVTTNSTNLKSANSTKINFIPSLNRLKLKIRPNSHHRYMTNFPYNSNWTQNLKAQKSLIDSSSVKLPQKFSPIYSTQQHKELKQKHQFLSTLMNIRQLPTSHKENSLKSYKSMAQRLHFKRARRLKRNMSWFGESSKYQAGQFPDKEIDKESWEVRLK